MGSFPLMETGAGRRESERMTGRGRRRDRM